MKLYLKYLALVGLVISLPLFGTSCSSESSSSDGEDQTGDISGVTVNSTSLVSGDFTPGVSVSADSDGSLKLTLTAVDVDGDGTVGTPSLESATVSSGNTTTLVRSGTKLTISDESLTCGEREVGSGSDDDQFDIAISLDTTASMGAAAGVLASKISEFAQALADAGVDAEFSGITVGDAFGTKDDPSGFDDAVSTGSLGEPPSFDECERPDVGIALISAASMSTFFTEVEEVVGTGCNGNGSTENYLAPMQLANDELEWREGSSRVMISIGDDCGYTPDTQADDSIVDPWSPPDPDDLIADLTATGTVVHVIGNDFGEGGCGSYYNMPDLAEETGGTFTEIGSCASEDTCLVDLTTLPITSSITSGVVGDCATSCALFESTDGEYTILLTINMVDGSTTYEAVLAIVLSLTLTC